MDSESSSSSSTGSSGRVSWDWGDVLNSSDLDTVSGKGSDGGLSSWSWGLGLDSTSSSKLDVHGVDTDILKLVADIDGSEHCYKM